MLPDLVLAEMPLPKKRATKNIEDIRNKLTKSIKKSGIQGLHLSGFEIG